MYVYKNSMFQRFYNMGSIIQAIRMFLSNSYKNFINTIMLSYYFHSTNVMQGLNPDPNKKRIRIKQKMFESFHSTSLGRSMERCRVRSQPLYCRLLSGGRVRCAMLLTSRKKSYSPKNSEGKNRYK